MLTVERFRRDPQTDSEARYGICPKVYQECLADCDHISRESVAYQFLEPYRIIYGARRLHRRDKLGDCVIEGLSPDRNQYPIGGKEIE
jgi:hypothetical protein